jgi:hypothetical protein
MDPTLTLRGEAFGAGFGYSMASLDANGDGSPGANVKHFLLSSLTLWNNMSWSSKVEGEGTTGTELGSISSNFWRKFTRAIL